MIRALSVLLIACFAAPASAGLLDLLPLKRIERNMLYPMSKTEVDPGTLALRDAKAHKRLIEGNTLVIWTLTASAPSAPTVLYFHGNAGNLANRTARFAAFQQQNINLIAMSYRGSSGSGGKPAEGDITRDAIAVYRQAETFITGAKPASIIVYGESLGSAVAIALLDALNTPERPAGVVLEAPFTSVPDMARSMTDVPDTLVARIRDRWDSLSKVDALSTPLLVLHGTADEVTPFDMGRRIFNAAPSHDKDFFAIKGASHTGTWTRAGTARLWRFINTYSKP